MRPGAIAAETREVLELERGRVILWVAPTRSGGFCWSIERLVGGCGTRNGGRMHANIAFAPGLVAVAARVRDRRIARLELRHEDGFVAEIPIVWVSEPIGIRFGVHVVPPARWRVRRPLDVLAYDYDGVPVRREDVRLEHVPPAPAG